mgnify:CR=1 FL=1
MGRRWLIPFFSVCFGFGECLGDERLSGGQTTVFVTSNKAFARPLANIGRLTRRQHTVGNSFFNQNWVAAPASTTARDGLGPLFNSRSCSACHIQDGRGAPPGKDGSGFGLLLRLSIPGQTATGGPVPDPVYGLQLSDRALPGVSPEGRMHVSYEEKPGIYHDGEPFSLRHPRYELAELAAGPAHTEIGMSPRVAPAVFGLGLLEAIEEKDLLSRADPQDLDGDGISGRPNRVWSFSENRPVLGRFGWKANQPDLRQQSAEAFAGDLGITSSLVPRENHTFAYARKHAFSNLPESDQPEVDDKILQRVTTYLQTIAPPARRNIDDPEVIHGQKLFREFNCATCHTPTMQTGNSHPIEELRNQTIRPYTDLLLHDMGPELSDGRSDYLAAGREWRTPPLWGIGLQERVNGHTTLLHDGRARNLAEAILWHGGEAKSAREAFRTAEREDRDALLAFLKSL